MDHPSDPAAHLAPEPTLRDLTTRECWEHLARQPVGRLACVLGGRAVLLPLNHRVHDRAVWFRTASWSRLGVHLPGLEVVFEVDDADPRTRSGWSVVARGTTEHVLTGVPGSPGAEDHGDPAPWPGGPRTMLFRLVPTELTGRLLRPAAVVAPVGVRPGSVQRDPGHVAVAPR
ncbi:pyridoxamine 5'-phosphate oxidase family protein [Nocardioides sp. Leaf374]|uniref:pyridoxamine 5'-phosphate oxidase family protein n=1 Tax=Nocardioides sp. Leaf374 TaxID=2876560 RepID=UPI001E5014F1|nr:pyridoxamine 5'-phosphate oxidase family protein [Nocardioides sp. Leaf374]